MALPSIVTPEYNITIPSTGQEIKYRPFLVKEEKLLLMAGEGESQEEQILAIAKVLADCIITPDIDVGSLAPFDMEYLFMRLRAKSVGENIKLNLKHLDVDSPTGKLESSCQHVTEYDLNIEDIKIPGPIPETKLQLTDTIGAKLRFPTFQDLAVADDNMNTARLFEMITDCIEYIYDEQEVYNEFTKEEMAAWIENLNTDQFKKLSDFFEEMPKLQHDLKWKCKECGKTDSIHMEGMQSFFT